MLGNVISGGFTQQQLASTASFQDKDLRGILLHDNDLSGWSFAGQDLAGSVFNRAKLGNADLSQTNLDNADFRSAVLAEVDFRGASLKNMCFGDESGENQADLAAAEFNTDTTYNQWTVFPTGFDPVAHGLTFVPSPIGDFDANDVVDVADVDLFVTGFQHPGWTGSECRTRNSTMFDMNRDGTVDAEDVQVWARDAMNTYLGDADLNGEFNSTDLIQAFAAGTYEKGRVDAAGNVFGVGATWSEGDWTGDGVFNSADVIAAFADGGYERGPMELVAAVPEPSSLVLCLPLILFGILRAATARRQHA